MPGERRCQEKTRLCGRLTEVERRVTRALNQSGQGKSQDLLISKAEAIRKDLLSGGSKLIPEEKGHVQCPCRKPHVTGCIATGTGETPCHLFLEASPLTAGKMRLRTQHRLKEEPAGRTLTWSLPQQTCRWLDVSGGEQVCTINNHFLKIRELLFLLFNSFFVKIFIWHSQGGP